MKLIMDSVIHLTELSSIERNTVKGYFRFKNPRANGPSTYSPSPTSFPAYNEHRDEIVIPRGGLTDLHRTFLVGVTPSWRRDPQKPSRWGSDIDLRPYQRDAVETVLSASSDGMIIMPTGSGKTQTALAILARLGRRTLWIAPGTDLAVQAMERARTCLGDDDAWYGLWGDGKREQGSRITFAVIDSAAKMTDDELNAYDVVLIDEAHNAAMGAAYDRRTGRKPSRYEQLLQRSTAPYRYGLTATPSRSDGLWQTCEWLIGGILVRVEWEDLYRAGHLIRPTIQVARFGYRWRDGRDPNPQEWTGAMAFIAGQAPRTQRLAADVLEALSAGGVCLVLSDRLEHLAAIQGIVGSGALIDGATPKERREQVWQATRERHEKAIFATYALAGEGLDVPSMTDVFFATPFRDPKRATQAAGRIMRPCAGKARAVVHDYIDGHGIFEHQFQERLRAYRAMGIQEINRAGERSA